MQSLKIEISNDLLNRAQHAIRLMALASVVCASQNVMAQQSGTDASRETSSSSGASAQTATNPSALSQAALNQAALNQSSPNQATGLQGAPVQAAQMPNAAQPPSTTARPPAVMMPGLMQGAGPGKQSDNAAQIIQNAQRNTAIYRAQAEEAKAREALDSATRSQAPQLPLALGPRTEPKEDAKTSSRPPEAPKPEPVAQRPKPPSLLAIFGRDASLQASIRMANGVISDVRVGDELDDGYKVKSITAKKVIVQINDELVTLAAWSGAAPAVAPTALPAANGQPGAMGSANTPAQMPPASNGTSMFGTNPALSAGGDPIRMPR